MSTPISDSAAIRQAIRNLRAAGWCLSYVDDGRDRVRVDTENEALDAILAVEDARLFLVNRATGLISWVRFVMGNDPDEVICDHGERLSPVLDALIGSWEV